MEEKTISAKLANIKRGRYFVLEYITTKNGLKKAVRGVFRFVKYENIKGVVKNFSNEGAWLTPRTFIRKKILARPPRKNFSDRHCLKARFGICA